MSQRYLGEEARVESGAEDENGSKGNDGDDMEEMLGVQDPPESDHFFEFKGKTLSINEGLDFYFGPGGWAHVVIDGTKNLLMVTVTRNTSGKPRGITIAFTCRYGLSCISMVNNFIRIEQLAE